MSKSKPPEESCQLIVRSPKLHRKLGNLLHHRTKDECMLVVSDDSEVKYLVMEVKE